ncbi:hypothetical protein BD413DRAFT_588781 [Trametes elegans]|nr:hypothetical protein BD413DRAFT_588781 [Trametes elegans]
MAVSAGINPVHGGPDLARSSSEDVAHMRLYIRTHTVEAAWSASCHRPCARHISASRTMRDTCETVFDHVGLNMAPMMYSGCSSSHLGLLPSGSI